MTGASEKMEGELSSNVSTHSQSQDADGAVPGSDSRRQKRPAVDSSNIGGGRDRKIQRVSRACDACKLRKSRCSGTSPCHTCVGKGLQCLYLSKYGRGRPPTPTAAPIFSPTSQAEHVGLGDPTAAIGPETTTACVSHRQGGWPTTLRAFTEPGTTEIQGQSLDPTSGSAFLHRAWRRLLATLRQPSLADGGGFAGMEKHQTQVAAGDKPFNVYSRSDEQQSILESPEALDLCALYFDVCIATYCFLHRPTVEQWLRRILRNSEQGLPQHHGVGELRTSIVLGILAIAKYHKGQSRRAISREEEAFSTHLSDQLFTRATRMIETATGFPNLESVQARLIQVLYLLHTSRMNQAWYVFGSTLPMITALGLHRIETRTRNSASKSSQANYIRSQCEKRVFWVSYILDRYLGNLFARPPHYRDDDIDQLFPDCFDDEDMTPQGPRTPRRTKDSYVTALVFNAKYVYLSKCDVAVAIAHVRQDD